MIVPPSGRLGSRLAATLTMVLATTVLTAISATSATAAPTGSVMAATHSGASTSTAASERDRGRSHGSIRHRGARRTSAGQTYIASVRVRTRDGRGRARIVLSEQHRSGKSVRRVRGRWIKVAGAWRTLETTIVARKSGSRLRLSVRQAGGRDRVRLKTSAASVKKAKKVNTLVSPSTTPNAAAGTSSSGLLAIAPEQDKAWGDTSKYRYMVIYAYQADRIPAIKAANPNTKVLVYLEAGAVRRRRDCATVTNPTSWSRDYSTFGMDYCWLTNTGRAHWLLRDSAGNPAEFNDYPDFMYMDMTNPEYARQWATNAAYVARTYGFDGVWADDINAKIGHGSSQLRRIGPNPAVLDDAAYGAGAVAWTKEMATALRAQPGGADLLLAANAYGDPWNEREANVMLQVADHLDIFNREHQTEWLTPGHYQCGPFISFQPDEINQVIDFAQKVQTRGVSYTAIDYGASLNGERDNKIMTFGRAMWLLSWNGVEGGAYFFRPCGTVAPSDNPRWMTDIGTPTGPMREEAFRLIQAPGRPWDQRGRLLVRDFTGGRVLLNTMPEAVTVPLEGTWRTADGRVVSDKITIPGLDWVRPGEPQGMPGGAEVLTRLS